MFTSKRSAIRLFEIQEEYTRATLKSFTDLVLHKRPVAGFRTVAELTAHCIIVRESSLASILADSSILKNLKSRFPNGEEIPAVTLEDLLELRRKSFATFCAGLKRFNWETLDKPFRTYFGNSSTARNYLTLILQEEIHHRGQILLICRLFGLTPPEAPYRELAELGVPQAP